MVSSLTRAGRFGLALVGAALLSPALFSTASAADKDLSANTLVVLSTDDFQGYVKALRDSDFGALLNDPEIQSIGERIKSGFSDMFGKMLGSSENSDKQEALEGCAQLIQDYLKMLCEKVNGRMALSLGYLETESGAIQPHIMMHLQGSEEIGQLHGRLEQFLGGLMKDAPVAKVSFELSGASFSGFDVKEEVPPSPVVPPDGLYFGQKGNNYYIGLTKRGLKDYITATSGTTTANRLGSESEYQRAVGAAGKGQSSCYFNLPALWRLVDRFLPKAGPVAPVIDALGLKKLGPMYATANATPGGAESSTFFGLTGREGVFQVFPRANTAMAMPDIVPRDVMSAALMRLELAKVLDIVSEVATKCGGEEAKQGIDSALSGFETQLGVKLEDLVGALEGTLLTYTQPGGGSTPGMGMGMSMGNLIVALKLKDSGVFQRLFESIAADEELGNAVQTEEFLGRRVYVVNPLAGGGIPVPSPAIVIDKGWFVFGSNPDVLRGALRAADGGEEGRLATDPEYRKLTASVAGPGIVLAYMDNATYLGDTVDGLRQIVGFLPMAIPQVGQNPELGFLFNPQNLPSKDVFRRYFGKTVQVCSVIDNGFKFHSWAPRVTKVKSEKAGAKLK